MDFLRRRDLDRLLNEQPDGPCVSIFLPTHRTGREMRQDPIRYKNVLADAEERLVDVGVRRPEARRMLQAAREASNGRHFWQFQGDGLALFLSKNRSTIYRLPLEFRETVHVESWFHIKPLLPLFQNRGRFYILAASQKDVRLFQATRNRISELHPPDLPEDLKTALGMDIEQSLQFHAHLPRSYARGGEESAMYHGHLESDQKQEIMEFFRMIDNALQHVFQDDRAPLVFAGVDFLFPIYQKVNHHQPLVTEAVIGNPELLSPEDLRRKAWEKVEPVFKAQEQESIRSFAERASHWGTSHDLGEILRAAQEGRVDSLFIARDEERWGVYDPKTGDVQPAEPAAEGSRDLLEVAMIETIRRNGRGFVVEPSEIPGGQPPIAAVFRYVPTLSTEPAATPMAENP